jgi:hypothetical protein
MQRPVQITFHAVWARSGVTPSITIRQRRRNGTSGDEED